LLQTQFIARNQYETGSKHLLDVSEEAGPYSSTHSKYHPKLRSFLERFGYYDVFLVDHLTGEIVYSVFKEVDFGTSLISGPYRETNIAEAFRAASAATFPGFVKFVDFDAYLPSYGAQASFVSSPIFDGEEIVGVLVFQMPVDRINDVMTSNREWSRVGLGETGEAYVVGSDFRMRTQSRFLIEDREGYLDAIRRSGAPPSVIEAIRSQDSSIGLQEVRTEGTVDALNGLLGVKVITDYRGVPVLSSFRPLRVKGMRWVIMSEIDQAEARAPVRAMRNRVMYFTAVLLAFIGIVAIGFSRSLTRPIRRLTSTASEVASGHLDVEIDVMGEDEIADLARSLDTMRGAVKEMIEHQERAIDALSVPLIPLRDDVVTMPLVGELDQRRLSRIRDTLINGVHDSKAKVALLDMTGVPFLDDGGAETLGGIARAARLIGAEVVITGVRPAIAASIANLDFGVDGLRFEHSLQSGVALATRLLEASDKEDLLEDEETYDD
jgi:anti-anti-sigma regulatory factor